MLNFSKEGGYVKLSLVVNDPPPASNGVKMKVKFILEVIFHEISVTLPPKFYIEFVKKNYPHKFST